MSTNPYSPDLAGSKIVKGDKKPKSRATSCERCKKRKQKCDHRLPTCTNCLKAGAQCVQPEKYALHVPEKDDYTILLETKVAKLQEQLERAGQIPSSPQVINSVPGQSPALSVASGSIATNSTTPTATSVGGSSTNGNSNNNNGSGDLDIPPQSTRVSILNPNDYGSDSSSSAPPPKSFSVVSSLLKDNFWGRNDAELNQSSVSESGGLLPDYNFDPYLKCRPAEIPDEATGKLLLEYYLNIQGKFPYLDRNVFIKMHNERHHRPTNLDDPTYRFNSFLLFGIYSLAVVLNLPIFGTKPIIDQHRLYATALCHARLCKSNDKVWQIKALLICGTFQMRTDTDEGCHFDMVKRSMRLCQELGLHQGIGFETKSLYEQEIAKRLFWAAYGLERLSAVSTGRPFVIDEKDVTITFPVDLDDDDLTEPQIRAARDEARNENSMQYSSSGNGEEDNESAKKSKITPLTFVIYLWRIRKLESEMVTDIYSTDKSMEELFSKVDFYLAALRNWRDNHGYLNFRQQNVASIAYSKAVRLLLQPFLASLDPNGPLFNKCVLETGRVCSVFRDFYRRTEEGFTTIAMHTIFIAGLTLVYCLWLSKDGDYLPILESIRVCTASLYLLTERSSICRNYRDTFEQLVSATIRHVTDRTRGIVHEGESSASAAMSVSNENPGTTDGTGTGTAASGNSNTTAAPVRPALTSADSATSIFQNITPQVAAAAASTSSSTAPQNQGPKYDTSVEDIKPNVDLLGRQEEQAQMTAAPSIQPSSAPLDPSMIGPQLPVSVNEQPVSTVPSIPAVASIASNTTPVIPMDANGWTQGPSQQPTSVTAPAQQATHAASVNGAKFGDRGWLDAYGYDDTMFNMIQDISSWTKGTNGGDVNNSDSQQIAEHMWMNFTDFSLT